MNRRESQKSRLPARRIRLRCLPLNIIATIAVAITTLIAAPAASAKDQGDHESNLGPGCAPDRPAIAHHAGGVIAHPDQDKEAPIPCSTNTGFRTGEIAVVVTNAGTILEQPARQAGTTGLPVGLGRSVDRGATWTFIQPSEADNPPLTIADSDMTIDRQTGRVFWISFGSTLFPQNPRLDISDDDGRTWFRGANPLPFDHHQIYVGPPTEGLAHLMQGYPNVVYACQGHKPLKCEKSLDGGLTWGPELDIPFPPELDAIQGPAHDCSGFGLNGVVAADGTVYLGVDPCNRPYVAISHDEGTTWQMSRVADTEIIGWGMVSPGIDKPGNLYAVFVAASDRLPYFAVSRDRGAHWSKPLMIGAPGVREAALPKLMASGTGHVAVAYYGSTNAPLPFPPICGVGAPNMILDIVWLSTPNLALGCPGYENERWNMYVTETWNAVSQQPLFWSAPLNDPAQPVWYGCSPSEMGVVRLDEGFISAPGYKNGCQEAAGEPVDYFGVNIAPDGTHWVGFPQGCPLGLPVPGNPNCPGTLTGAPADALWGMVGRLVRVHAEADEDNEH